MSTSARHLVVTIVLALLAAACVGTTVVGPASTSETSPANQALHAASAGREFDTQPDVEVAATSSVVADRVPFELAPWSGSIDPEVLLNRVGATDQWSGSLAATRPADPSERRCGVAGALAPGNTEISSRSWFHDERFVMLAAHTYRLASDDAAAEFVATAQSQVLECVDSIDASTGTTSDDAVVPSGVTAGTWLATSSAIEFDDGRTLTQWHFFSRYGSDVYHALLQPEDAEPTVESIAGLQALLVSFEAALRLGPLLPAPEYSTSESEQLETFLIEDYGSEWLLWDPEDFECFADEFRTFDRPNGAAEYIVERWCVPDFQAQQWAATQGTGRFGSRIEDDDQRLCYATAMVMSLRGSSFQDALRIEQAGSPFSDISEDINIRTASPESPLRAAFDSALFETCGITPDEAVIAGLSPHEPLDDSPEREPFCDGWSEGLVYDRDLAEVDKLVARYTALAERSNRLASPAEILDDWDILGTYYAEKARVHAEGRLSETEIFDHEEFQAFQDEIGFIDANDAVFEYLRINCGYEPR